VQAFVSTRRSEDSWGEILEWWRACKERATVLFAEQAPGLKVTVGGAVTNPSAGVFNRTFSGELDLDREVWPLEAGTAVGTTRLASVTSTAEAVGVISTFIGVSHEGTNVDLRCEIFGFDDYPLTASTELRGLLERHVEVFPADFGNVAPDNGSGRTRLEMALRRPAATGRAEAREVLRGYGWTTYIPGALAPVVLSSLEGAPGMVIREPGAGGLVVVAGDRIEAYQEDHMNDLFQYLAPVLSGGEPRIQRPRQGLPPEWLVARDARDVAGYGMGPT
jgi:hypothetical protein